MKSEHNLSIEQLQLIKLIENINQKYRQRCNIDKNKVLSDTNLKMLKSILPGLIILYKWNQEKKDSAINLEELIDQQLIKYRRIQNILNKKMNIIATDKKNYSFKKDKNLIRLEYLAKIIKFISQEKTIQKKIRDLKVSENDCIAILNKLNKLSYKIHKTATKEKLHTSKYISAILSRQKSLEKTGINYLEDTQIENLSKIKSQVNTNKSERIILEKNPKILINTLHTIENISKEEKEKAINVCKTRILNQEVLTNQDRQFSPKINNNSETLVMYENKNKILNDSSDESCDNLYGTSIDNNESIYSSSMFVSCNEIEDTNKLIKSAILSTDNTKKQKRKQLINDYSYVLSIHNSNKTDSITSTSQSPFQCSCNECQEGNLLRLRGGKTRENVCLCPQCLCEKCAGNKGKSKSCNCGNPCRCDPCGDTKEIEEIVSRRMASTRMKSLQDTQSINAPCSCPINECPCNPCNDPERVNEDKFQCGCAQCCCNPCKDPRKKLKAVCDDTTCENQPPKSTFPAVCACPNCECNECSDPSHMKSKAQLNDLSSLKSICYCAPNGCNCNPCKCVLCNDPACNKPASRKNLPKCDCPPGDACKCDPCSDPSRKKAIKCFCPEGSCPCDPCSDVTRSKVPNKCFCPEGSCPCDPCGDPTQAKLNKCHCPENLCSCEKCTDPTKIKRINKKCNCPEDDCQCIACTDSTRVNKPKRVCACPINACPCKACGDPTRTKLRPCNCPEGACKCDNCPDPTRTKTKPPNKCNCPEDSCLCKPCGDLDRSNQMRAKQNNPKECSCPENYCPCEECPDPTRTKTKKCTCAETFCPCETCEDSKRADQNRREKFMNNDICGCPKDACQCEACVDQSRGKPKKCSCPAENCPCENCADPDRATKKCVCPQDNCLCVDCSDPNRKKKLCSCPIEYCPCEECGDKDRAARNKEIHSCNCKENACLCSPCSDPRKAKQNKCSCPKDSCSCENCGDITRRKKSDECTCPKDFCPCEPCKDATRQKKIIKCECEPNACTCTECQDPTVKKTFKCSCMGECTCNLCNDPTIKEKNLKIIGKKCDCIGECNCNPCEDPDKKICKCISCKCFVCNQSQFKKEKHCTCKSCTCIECSDPKHQKKKFCTCQPQCECKYCSLPRKTVVHSVTSLYKSAVSVVCDRISTLMDKTRSIANECNIKSVQSQKDKEICVIYQPNRQPGCTCEQCICDPCCPTVPDPAPLPTEMLCVCDIVQSIDDSMLRDTIPEKFLPIDCTCDKCTCDPCIPPIKELRGGDTCVCPSPCTCCDTCNKFKKDQPQASQPPQPLKNAICLMEGCTCINQCCCNPCQPKPKNMSKCKCIGICKCNACAKPKIQVPDGCTCDNCTCDPCKPQVKDESKCVCGRDTCDCDACPNEGPQFKTRSSANAPPYNVPQQHSIYGPSDCNANKHNEICTCGPSCTCDEKQDAKIPCKCFECKCQKWQDDKHEFCCICDDKSVKCDFKCTCGEHCPCETQLLTIPVKDTLIPSDCTCDPCTCNPCFTKDSKMEKILSKVRTDPNQNNSSSLPCSCQPMCRCGDCFNENVTKVHSYSDKKTKEQKNDCDLAQNTMIIKADEIQINEVCNCCKCSDKNNKSRDPQQQNISAENYKKRSEKLQESENKNEKQSMAEKTRMIAVIKSVCEKTQQNNEKQQQRVIAVINNSCQENQQKIEIQEGQQQVVAIINSRCHEAAQYTEKQQSKDKEEKHNVCHPDICEKRKQKLVEVMSTCLNEEIQLHQYKMQQKQKHAVVTKKPSIIYPCIKVETNPCPETKIDTSNQEKVYSCLDEKIDLCQEDKKDSFKSSQEDKVDSCKEEKINPWHEKKVDPCPEKKVHPCVEEKVDPCQEEKVNPCQEKNEMKVCRENQKTVSSVKEKMIYPIRKIDPCQKEVVRSNSQPTPACLEVEEDTCQEEQRLEPCYTCDNDGYSSLKTEMCLKLRSKFHCIKTYFGDYFSELIKSRAKEADNEDECTCDICKCRREIRHTGHNHKSPITQDCACSSACKDVGCSNLTNDSTEQPCCSTNVSKAEPCLAIISSKKDLSICSSRKAIPCSKTNSAVDKVDCNTSTRGLGASYLDEFYHSENVQKDSSNENLKCTRTSSKDKSSSFIELYDYKQNNKGLHAMAENDDINREIVSQTYSPVFNLERKYNQDLRINDTENTSKSSNPITKYTNPQIYCVDIKNDKQNLLTKLNQRTKIIDHRSYLLKNVKSLHSSITDLEDNEWNHENNLKLNRTNTNLLTTNDYKYCTEIDTNLDRDSSYTTAIKSITPQYSDHENNWYFINMQGIVPMSDNMDYKYMYHEQRDQPIMINLSGQLSTKLSESINYLHSSKDAFERFISDSKRVGINIPFVSTKSRKSNDLKSNDSSHIPKRENANLRKTPQNDKTIQSSQNNYFKNIDKNNSRSSINHLNYTQDQCIRKRGGAIPKDNIKNDYSKKTELSRYPRNDDRENSRNFQRNDNFFPQDLEPLRDERKSGKIIDELYLNDASNDSSKIIDIKNEKTVNYNINNISFCSAIENTPNRSFDQEIFNRNSTEYDRFEHHSHFARGGGYNPKIDNNEINDIDYENSLLQAYSGIIRKTISDFPKTEILSENKYYSTSNLNNFNISTAEARRSSPLFIDDYILVNRAKGLNSTMSTAEMIPDNDLYTNSFESISSSVSKEKEKPERVEKKFLDDQNLPHENPDQVSNFKEKKEEENVYHSEECTCRMCICGDCNCKICECEKGAKEKYERIKEEKKASEEKAKYCTCYICECNECNCTKCECDADKFPQGIPLSMVVCPCTNCDCGIPCKEGGLLKTSKFFLTRDNDLFKIPDNVNQDMKIKILNAVQNVNIDIKFAIKKANLQVSEAMNVADKMVQNAVLQLCKMDNQIKYDKNAIQTPFDQSPKFFDLSNNEIELLIASDDEKLKDTIIHANKHVINAVSNAKHSVTDAISTANKNLESALLFLLPGAVTEGNTSFTEAKGAIDDSDDNKHSQQSSNQQPPNTPPNSNERKKSASKKGNCDCPHPCQCEDCPDQPHEPPPCDCPKPCECVGCPTLNIPIKTPHCRCKTCLCDPCLDKQRKKGSPIEKFLCGCKPECMCEKCPAKPGCECEGECVCAVCPHKERKCDCAICLCNDCAVFKQVQQLCDCPQCLCNVCEKGGGVIPTKPPKLIYNMKCKCAVCLCDNCTSDKIQITCSCPICLCDKCPEMESNKPAFECSCYPQCTCDKCSDPNVKCVSKRQKEEPYKCTCIICYCEKCSDPTKERQDPCEEEHPKDCTCLKCACSPCLSKKQKVTECKCEKCKCSPCKMLGGMLTDCKCDGECKCINCQYKTANIDECICKICECNKKVLCTVNATTDGNEMRKLEISECTCEPCNCNPCLAQGGHPPNCKCPKCMCTKCDIKPLPACDEGIHPPDCKCNVCYCAPCKYDTDPNCDTTFRVSCTCETCSCKPCKAKGDSCDDDDDFKKLATPRSCKCIKCECFPCILPRTEHQGTNIDKNLPTCLCKPCTCNPCMAAPPDICNEPREPPKYVPDCLCPKCFCDPCTGKAPVNPCDLMKIDTTVVCTCTPKCDCKPCTLPPAIDPRKAKSDHPETCKCDICVCTQCEMPKNILQPLLVDHSDDCQCRTCLCKPCKLKPDHKTRLDKTNHGPECKCKVCCCNPCKLQTNNSCHDYSNLPDCVCTVCNCGSCKAKPKNCEKCPECYGKGDCKCLHCECVPCTKTQPEFCNCELCRCINCLSLETKKFIPNCNCLLCLCKQPEQAPTNQLSACQTENDPTKKCPVICPLNTIHKKTGRKKCSCSICYCDPCQPIVTNTTFEYTFKPPENNPLKTTLKVNEQKKCLCEPCLCKTCPQKMNKEKCSCYICKCENCSFKQNKENDLICKCSRPCPCISCKGRGGGAGSGNITTDKIDHVRGGATTSTSEIQSVEETDGETKCSCTDPCVCQSCAGEKFQRELKKCDCPAPCTCEHCPDTYNKAYLCTCYGTCTCRSCPATQHESLLKCNPNDQCLCLEPCCCIDCSGKKHLNKTDNNECTCKNLCTCETCISKSNERRKLLNQIQDDQQVPCDCEKPCTCAVCLGNTGLNFVNPFGQSAPNQESYYDVKHSENDPMTGIITSENIFPNSTFPTCQIIPNITNSICDKMLDNESHVICDKLQDNETNDVILSNNDKHDDDISVAIHDNKDQLGINKYFDDETNKIMITETKSDKRNYEEVKPPCACTTSCVSASLHSPNETSFTTDVEKIQLKTDDCNIVKKLANQISSLITKPFQVSNASSHPSAVSNVFNNLLNCDCPIPCLCPDKDQCGTYQFMNAAEKDTSTKHSNTMDKITSNKTYSETQIQTKKHCKCVGMCHCSTPQMDLTQKQQISDTSKYSSNKNLSTNTRIPDQTSSNMYQSKTTCDCVGTCECSNKKFVNNQKASSDITNRISTNFKKIIDSSNKQINKIISSKSQNTQFHIFETRKLTEDSLLIKWTPANVPCLTGYEIYVNGSLSHRVRNKDRYVAVLFNICYDKPVNISVFPISTENRNHPPAVITVC